MGELVTLMRKTYKVRGEDAAAIVSFSVPGDIGVDVAEADAAVKLALLAKTFHGDRWRRSGR